MPSSLQQLLHDRACYSSHYRSYKELIRNRFVQNVYGDEQMMARMTLERVLSGHTGCVNSLYWSRRGEQLLSGSDDMNLILWSVYLDYQYNITIETGHRANIFSAVFMPKTNDHIIVSAAGDSEVRVFDLNAEDMHRPMHIYTCHDDRVKRIAIDDNNPYEFLTCSEDGTIRQFDLREPHICTPHNSRSFLTATQRPSREYPSQRREGVREGCSEPLVDYSRYGIDINTISLNKIHPQYFAIAGMDDYIYLHDRRMVSGRNGGGGAGRNKTHANSSRCIKRFTASSDGRRRRNKHITACKFSESNGEELLGSWSADDIYLFHMNDSPTYGAGCSNGTFSQSSAHKGNGFLGRINASYFNDMAIIHEAFYEGDLNEALEMLSEFSRYTVGTSEGMDLAEQYRKRTLAIWELSMLAACHLRRVYEREVAMRDTENGLDEVAEEEVALARKYMQEAESLVPPIWEGYWCLAVGYFIAAGGTRSNGCEDREEWLHKAYDFADFAYYARSKKDDAGSDSVQSPQINPLDHVALNEDPRVSLDQDEDENEDSEDNRDSFGDEDLSEDEDLDEDLESEDDVHDEDDDKDDMDEDEDEDDDDSSISSSDELPMIKWFTYDVRQAIKNDWMDVSLDELESESDDTDSSNPDPLRFVKERYRWLEYMYIFTPFSPLPSLPPGQRGSTDEPGSNLENGEQSTSQQEQRSASLAISNDNERLQSSPSRNEPSQVSSTADSPSRARQHQDVVTDSEAETAPVRRAYHGNVDEESSDEEVSDDEHENTTEFWTESTDHPMDDIDSDFLSMSEDVYNNIMVPADRDRMEDDVEVVGYRQKYTGHCNVRTIKDVNFYGPNDKYIVSGSDDGLVFVWDKKSTKIVQILKGDEDTVNVIQGHPFLPIMAVSGIDDTVKLFKPMASPSTTSRTWEPHLKTSWSPSSRMYDMDDIVRRNQDNRLSEGGDLVYSRNIIAILTAIMRNRRFNSLQSDGWGPDDTDSNQEDEAGSDRNGRRRNSRDDDEDNDEDESNSESEEEDPNVRRRSRRQRAQ
ncbi:WD40-repeat-containing domain protein [Radiomyces spectabilis]|uniref:WD40-repeat-containing domain protein n=1 Tax=Radiomyces spectabilis TaxID=64574 RepID=UPI00221E5A3A|nr:WD40-repeat-containing domain protein [Radiomyces spectabilis]KAI8380899.1 WD40-repeat-containing domain protein [Radiomyces spectabilis]